MTNRNLAVIFLSVGALVLTACPKGDEPADGSTDTTVDDEVGDTDDGESTGESGETTSDDGTTSSGFVPEDDIADANTCDPWAQDCPEGEKCAAYAVGDTWDATKCVPIMGDGTAGDECTYNGATLGTDTCDVGHMCYYTDQEGTGICVEQCTGTPDQPLCNDGFNCSISNDGSLLLCLYNCNPLLQDCEQDMTGCYWDGSLFNCDPSGDIPEGESCGYINDCGAGNICLGAESLPSCAGSSCCAGFCDLDDPQCGINGTECVAFYEPGTAPPGLDNVGICALPG